jgi:hypothetical protein
LVNKSEYDSTERFTNGYSICHIENEGYYAVYKNGLEVKIDINIKTESTIWIHRYNDVFIAEEINSITEWKNNILIYEKIHKFHIYVNLKLQSIIFNSPEARHCSVGLKNNLIEIVESGNIGVNTTVKYFSLDGKEISKSSIEHPSGFDYKISDNIISFTDIFFVDDTCAKL